MLILSFYMFSAMLSGDCRGNVSFACIAASSLSTVNVVIASYVGIIIIIIIINKLLR